jgi:cobalt/nickel transport system permease protein
VTPSRPTVTAAEAQAAPGGAPPLAAADQRATRRPRRLRRLRRNVLESTLGEVSHALAQSLFAEEIARQPGLFQSLDPRVKIITTLALLLAVSLSRSVEVIVALYAVTVVLAALSSISVGFFIRRVWLFMPFFTLIIAIPAFFTVPGPPLARLPLGLIITRTGALTALFLLLRVSTSVSLGMLLVLTTPWNTLLKALQVLKVPDSFILILGMTFRYIYLLLNTLDDMLLSRKSRVVGRLDGAAQRRVIGATAGTLLGKSLALSGDVYLAMQSRGYRGTPRTLDTFQMRRRDWAWGAGLLAIAALMIWLGR